MNGYLYRSGEWLVAAREGDAGSVASVSPDSGRTWLAGRAAALVAFARSCH